MTRTEKNRGGGTNQAFQNVGIVPGRSKPFHEKTPGEKFKDIAQDIGRRVEKMYKGPLRKSGSTK